MLLASDWLLVVVGWSAVVPFAAAASEQGGAGTLGMPELEDGAAVHIGIPVPCQSQPALSHPVPQTVEFD